MQNTSALYDELVATEGHWFETTLVIGEQGVLLEERGDKITFGGDRILVDSGGATDGFPETMLKSVSTSHNVFGESHPVVGSTVGGQIDIVMLKPIGEVPKRARLVPYVRVTDGERFSEWLQKGVYYVDTRRYSKNAEGEDVLEIHGFDSMLSLDIDYPSDNTNDYPLLDTLMVQFLASSIGISVDPRTFVRMDKSYLFPLPVGYSAREVLGIIAASYGGNFVISDMGELLLIRLCDLPRETNILITENGDQIVFGYESGDDPVRILVY